jgi:hypothetical protein
MLPWLKGIARGNFKKNDKNRITRLVRRHEAQLFLDSELASRIALSCPTVQIVSRPFKAHFSHFRPFPLCDAEGTGSLTYPFFAIDSDCQSAPVWRMIRLSISQIPAGWGLSDDKADKTFRVAGRGGHGYTSPF